MNSKEIILSPSRYYSNPKELIGEKSLNQEQKVKALENWKEFIIQQLEGEAEGMESYKVKKVEIKDIDHALEKVSNFS